MCNGPPRKKKGKAFWVSWCSSLNQSKQADYGLGFRASGSVSPVDATLVKGKKALLSGVAGSLVSPCFKKGETLGPEEEEPQNSRGAALYIPKP